MNPLLAIALVDPGVWQVPRSEGLGWCAGKRPQALSRSLSCICAYQKKCTTKVEREICENGVAFRIREIVWAGECRQKLHKVAKRRSRRCSRFCLGLV